METQIEVPKVVLKKGFQFLRELTSFNADFNAFSKRTNPITNRVTYIMHQLDTLGIPYVIDKFEAVVGVPDFVEGKVCNNFVNIVVTIEGIDTLRTTVFLAHHDVANMQSENANDNTASVANLLDLCVQLSKEKPSNNVVIAFVDAEEIVAPQICGSQRLAQNILTGKHRIVKYAVNLELSANGRNYWMSYNRPDNELAQHLRVVLPTINRVRTPYNDGFILEKEGVPSVCIGSLNDNNLSQVHRSGYCRTWAMCHKAEDTFISQAVEADMDLFVTFLETLI